MMRTAPSDKDSPVRATPFPTFSENQARPSFLAGLALLVLAVAICFAGGMAAGYQGGALPRPADVTWRMIQDGMPYSACGLLVLFAWQHVRQGILKAFVGERVLGPLVSGLFCLGLAFGICYVVTLNQNLPREPYLTNVFHGLNPEQVQRLMLQLVLFSAITEELLLRHYFMRVCGWQDGGLWKWSAIVTSALVYPSFAHPFVNVSSMVLMVAVGVIIGIARANSKGMLVPILLHGATMAVVLLHPQVSL